MQRDEDETEIMAAYRHLSRLLHITLAGRDANADDLKDLLRSAYQLRAKLHTAIEDAQRVIGDYNTLMNTNQ